MRLPSPSTCNDSVTASAEYGRFGVIRVSTGAIARTLPAPCAAACSTTMRRPSAMTGAACCVCAINVGAAVAASASAASKVPLVIVCTPCVGEIVNQSNRARLPVLRDEQLGFDGLGVQVRDGDAVGRERSDRQRHAHDVCAFHEGETLGIGKRNEAGGFDPRWWGRRMGNPQGGGGGEQQGGGERQPSAYARGEFSRVLRRDLAVACR